MAIAICTAATLVTPVVPSEGHARSGLGGSAFATPRTVPRTLAGSVTRTADPAGTRAVLSFPATHIAFSWTGEEGTGVRYRTRHRPGWRVAPEAHDMEHGRHHYSGVIPVARPTTVEWKPIHPDGVRMGPVTFDYLNTLDGARVAAARTTSASAPGVPPIVTRVQWGADESIKKSEGDCTRAFFKVQQLFVHHTAGNNYDPHPRATMRAIYWYHTVRRGWCDIGYNFVIGWDGRVYEGRWARRYRPWEPHSSEDRIGRAVRGAHVEGFNTASVGVSLMGNFSTAPVPARMRGALIRVLAWQADRHDLSPTARHLYRNPETGLRKRLPYIAGHRDAGQTACPGGNIYSRLAVLRRAVKRAIGAGRFNTSVALGPSQRTLSYGSRARLSGRLIRHGGTGMPAREIALYARARPDRWRLSSTVTTRAGGRFTRLLRPAANTTLVAVYVGGRGSWGSQSLNRRIAVKPDVSLVPDGAEKDSGGVFRYPSGVTEVNLSGTVRPPHPRRRVRLRVSEVLESGATRPVRRALVSLDRASRYRYRFVPTKESATYRAVTTLAGHLDHAASASRPVMFAISSS